ncbi:MAG: hypothetical protein K0S34_2713 [Bacillales bacterium]|jgi:hypothetical protein|nr:hypothetical protein [Bacillales bacterium]
MNQQQMNTSESNLNPNQVPGQVPMTEVPFVLTTKDVSYISDMLSWNLLAMKKAHFFAQQCQDQEIKQAIEGACTMHQRHYDKLLQHMGSHMNSQTH